VGRRTHRRGELLFVVLNYSLLKQFVTNEQEALDLIKWGEQYRAVSSTNMNERSSRSHSLFMITVQQKSPDGSIKHGKLNLVDLAGSEKVSKTGSTGETLEEAKKINQSLSALGNVINALCQTKRSHIPYRDSKLTFILKESLGGNCKTTLLITCSPHLNKLNFEETISTLKFGQRAKTIKNNVTVNKQRSVAELNEIIKKLRDEIAQLRKYIAFLENEVVQLKLNAGISNFDINKFRNDAFKTISTERLKKTSDDHSEFLNLRSDVSESPHSERHLPTPSSDNEPPFFEETTPTAALIDPIVAYAELQLTMQRMKEDFNLRLQELNEELNSLKDENKTYEDKATALQAQLNDKDALIKTLMEENEKQKKLYMTEKSRFEYDFQQLLLEKEKHVAANLRLQEFAEMMEQNFKAESKEKELIVRDHNRITKVNETLQKQMEENELKIQQLVAKVEELKEIDKKKTAQLLRQTADIEILRTQVAKLEEIRNQITKNSRRNSILLKTLNTDELETEPKVAKQEVAEAETVFKQQQQQPPPPPQSQSQSQPELITMSSQAITNPSIPLQQENEVLRKEVMTLRNLLEKKEMDEQKSEMRLKAQEETFNKLTIQIAGLQAKLKAYEEQQEQKEIQQKYKTLENERTRLQKRVEELELSLQTRTNQLTSTNEDFSKLQRELKVLRSENEILQKQIQQTSQRVTELENISQEREIDFEAMQNQLQQQLQTRFEELKKLHELLDSSESLIRKLKEENLVLSRRASKVSRNTVVVRTVSGRSWRDIFGRKQIVQPQAPVTEKCGYLIKQGALIRNWKRRWCTVSGDSIYYYDDKNSKEPKGSIPLRDCVVQPADDVTKRPNSFAIFHTKNQQRTFFLQAETKEQFQEWFDFLTKKLEQLTLDFPKKDNNNPATLKQTL